MEHKWVTALVAVLAVSLSSTFTEGANVLALLPSLSPSHLIIEMAVVRALVERNHNVTVVTVLPLKSDWLDSRTGLTHIQLTSGKIDMTSAINATKGNGLKRIVNSFGVIRVMSEGLAEILDDAQFVELINNPHNRYDLMLYGYLFGDFLFGIAEHFNCPLVLIWPNVPLTSILRLIGNPIEISYTAFRTVFSIMNRDRYSFVHRLQNALSVGLEGLIIFKERGFCKKIYEKHFPPEKYRSYDEARQRVSMVLFSHHFTEKPVRPLVPALVEIGGIHLDEKPKPLPQDIEEFLSRASENGAILFSLGTNLRTGHLQPNTLQKIFNVLSKLPQKVIWKCDDEAKVPGKSRNILYKTWLPQADILAHPNVRLFFGHGGKGSITEAEYYGVPIVGLPIFGDQPMNMNEVVAKGYGLSIDNSQPLTEDIIRRTVNEVLHNDTYANTVKAFSRLYRDRPLSARENAVFWLEYLIRHKGAPHMQSPLKNMNLIEAYNIDVLLFISTVSYVSLKIVVFVVKFCLRKIRKAPAEKVKSS